MHRRQALPLRVIDDDLHPQTPALRNVTLADSIAEMATLELIEMMQDLDLPIVENVNAAMG